MEPDQSVIEFNLGFKLIDGMLMEVEGAYLVYSDEYTVDEVPWSKVVSFDSLEIQSLITNTFDTQYNQLPVLDADTEDGFTKLCELKKEAGYSPNEYGDFVLSQPNLGHKKTPKSKNM